MNTNDRAIVGLVMVGHAMVHTYELSIPILMTVWLTELEVSTSVLGVASTAGYALFGLGALPSGILVDRWGSRRLIAACLAGMGASFVLLSLAQSVWTITVALVAWGAAASIYHPAGLSLISTGVQARGHAFALHGMAGNAGIALGPLLTALLLIGLDWHLVAAGLALPAAAATVYAWRASFDEHAAEAPGEASEPEAHPLRRLWTSSRQLFATGFAAVFAVVMLSGLYYRGALTFLPELLTPLVTLDLPVDLEPGRYVYAGLLMVGIGGQYVGGRLTDWMRTERALAVAFLALAGIAVAFLPVARTGTGGLVAISVALGFVLFLVQPLYQATVALYTPTRVRGLSYGFTYLGVFGIGALGAAIAGAVLQFVSPTALFAVLAGFAGVAALVSGGLALRPAP
jgi:MFS family permease